MIGERTMTSHEEWETSGSQTGATRTMEWDDANILICQGNDTGKKVFLPAGNASNSYGWCQIVNITGQSMSISHDTAATGNVANTVVASDITLGENKTATCRYVPYLANSPVNGKFAKKVAGVKRGLWTVSVG